MSRLLSAILRTIIVPVFFLSSCATSQNNIEPSPVFQIKEDVISRVSLQYKVHDAELVITEQAVYVIYREDQAHLNLASPAYICPYKNFLREPTEEYNSVGIVCHDNKETKINYFHISDSVERNKVLKIINKQLINHYPLKQTGANAYNLSDLQSIGISSSDVCISELNDEDNKASKGSEDFNPAMAMHPEIAPYIVADPATLIAMGILMPIETWKEKRRLAKYFGNVRPIGSSSDFSLVLANIAHSSLENKVAYISKPCKTVIEVDSEIGAINSNSAYEGYKELSNSFAAIIEIDDFHGELFSDYRNRNTELRFSCLYILISTDSGHVISFGKIQYSHTNPSALTKGTEISNEEESNMLNDIYREIAHTIISNLKSKEQ